MPLTSVKDWRVCLVVDPELFPHVNLLKAVTEAVAAGISSIQLRVKSSSTRHFFELATQLASLLRASNTPFIINDRVDIALACRADGVHLGQEDLPLAAAREILGPRRIIGISVNTVEEARAAEEGGADYIGVGPIFPTTSKKELRKILGLPGLREIRQATKLPILAIGGIKPENAASVHQAGADGVAVISAVLGKSDIKVQVNKLLQALEEI
jgi:thiamine-phosphate pyrophosphorylase